MVGDGTGSGGVFVGAIGSGRVFVGAMEAVGCSSVGAMVVMDGVVFVNAFFRFLRRSRRRLAGFLVADW